MSRRITTIEGWEQNKCCGLPRAHFSIAHPPGDHQIGYSNYLPLFFTINLSDPIIASNSVYNFMNAHRSMIRRIWNGKKTTFFQNRWRIIEKIILPLLETTKRKEQNWSWNTKLRSLTTRMPLHYIDFINNNDHKLGNENWNVMKSVMCCCCV